MINSSTWLRGRLTGSIVKVTLVPEQVTVLCRDRRHYLTARAALQSSVRGIVGRDRSQRAHRDLP